MIWTQANLDKLAAMRTDGKTFGQIARDLGCTRNAACGCAYRLGLMRPLPVKRAVDIAAKNERAMRLEIERLKKARHDMERAETEIARIAAATMPEPMPRGDVDDGCRWLHGEAAARNFCGAPEAGATSWCAFHRAIAFNRVSTKESERRFRAKAAAA